MEPLCNSTVQQILCTTGVQRQTCTHAHRQTCQHTVRPKKGSQTQTPPPPTIHHTQTHTHRYTRSLTCCQPRLAPHQRRRLLLSLCPQLGQRSSRVVHPVERLDLWGRRIRMEVGGSRLQRPDTTRVQETAAGSRHTCRRQQQAAHTHTHQHTGLRYVVHCYALNADRMHRTETHMAQAISHTLAIRSNANVAVGRQP